MEFFFFISIGLQLAYLHDCVAILAIPEFMFLTLDFFSKGGRTQIIKYQREMEEMPIKGVHKMNFGNIHSNIQYEKYRNNYFLFLKFQKRKYK